MSWERALPPRKPGESLEHCMWRLAAEQMPTWRLPPEPAFGDAPAAKIPAREPGEDIE